VLHKTVYGINIVGDECHLERVNKMNDLGILIAEKLKFSYPYT